MIKGDSFWKKKLSESIGQPKDLWKALKSFGLPNKNSSCEVSALKTNNTVEHDDNLILEGFKNYYSALAENLLNMLPKALNKYSINTRYYEHMIQGSHFDLASVSENAILDGLSECFLKDGAKFLAKPISDLCNLWINSEKFPDSGKVAKLRPLYKKGSLTQPCNYRPISLLPLISKVIEKVIHDQTSTFLNSKQLLSS